MSAIGRCRRWRAASWDHSSTSGPISWPVAYPGYSFADQAVSELFAIGAPGAGAVVGFFTLSSALMVLFA